MKPIKEIAIKQKQNKKVKGLYICGSYGIGKTHLMHQLIEEVKEIHELKKNGEIYAKHIVRKGLMLVFPELVAKLKENMNDETKSKINMTQYYDIPVLVIDDIGGEIASDWMLRDILFPLLNHRITKHLTTCFTSNFTIEMLRTYYIKRCSEDAVNRVIDRIHGLAKEIKLTGKNKRRELEWTN